MNKPKLGDILLEANLIDEVQMRIALEEQKRLGTKFGSTLISLHFIDENVLTAFLSKQLDMPCVSLNNIEITPKVLAKIPAEMARRLEVMPIKLEGGRLYVAMTDPMDMEAVEEIEGFTGLSVVPMIAPQSSVRDCLHKRYVNFADTADMTKEAPSIFPEMIKEIEELQTLGPAFEEVKIRLVRIEELLEKLISIVENSRDRSRNG